MLLDRTHKRWLVGSTLAAALGAAAYCVIGLSAANGPKGGSLLGMLFGILGSACLVFAALLAVRRRLPTLRIGSAQFWLRGHLWLGTLGSVLILFHSGFGWGGLLENLLWVSLILVVVTGFFGVILQQVIPRLLTSEVPLETMVSQIPSLSRMSAFKADKLVASKVGVLEVDFEPLMADALNVLKRQEQSIGERPDDFPRELAKTYANVPLPQSDKHPPAAPVSAPIVPTNALRPQSETPPVSLADSTSTAQPPNSPVLTPDKPQPKAIGAQPVRRMKPLALKREKAALKAAAKGAVPPVAELPTAPPMTPEVAVPPPEIQRSPVEQLPANDDAPVGVSPMFGKPQKHLISITCARCGKIFTVAPRHAGKQGRCPIDACQAPYTVPLPDEPPAEPVRAAPQREFKPSVIEKKGSLLEQLKAKLSAAMTQSLRPSKPKKKLITIMCTSCGSIFTVSTRHAGKQGRCPVDACQAPYTVPFIDSAPAMSEEPDKLLRPEVEKSPTPTEQMRIIEAQRVAALPPRVEPAPPQPSIERSPAKPSSKAAPPPPREEPVKPLEKMPAEPAAIVTATQPSELPEKPLAPVDVVQFKPVEPEIPEPPCAEPVKPLPPVEQVRVELAEVVAPTPPSQVPAKPLSPLEQVRAKQAAAAAAAAAAADQPARPLSPIEQIRAKQAAKATPAAPSDEPAKPLSQLEQVRAKQAAKATPAAPINEPAKPLSPIEQMRAKRAAAAKGSPADQPAETSQPLTAEKAAAPLAVSPPAIVVKTAAEKPAIFAPAPVKPKRRKASAPISPALLAELRDFHINIVRPFLITGRSPLYRLDDSATARQLFAQLRADLPTELHHCIQDLFVLCEERRQFNTQLRLHRWLHWWLMVHIPPAIALMVLFVAHVVVSLRVVPFGR